MNAYIQNTCKIGQEAECCKYLIVGSKGFECAKFDLESKRIIDHNWALHEHVAQGDNCPGVEDLNSELLTQS